MSTAPHNAALFLTRHTVDPVRGFLPVEDPVQRLPPAFTAWEELTAELPKLLCAGHVRRVIRDLPLLDATQLEGAAEHDRAMLLLSYLGHAYVFGEENPRDTVPEPIARPWHQVATVLDRPPVLSYASHALANWRRLDRLQPVRLDNIARLENFLGGVDEDWFVLVHIAIEALAGPGLVAAVEAQDAVTANDPSAVTAGLETVAGTMENMLATLRCMPEKCDPYIYYTRVRQFIFGWMENPALPEGVYYEGVAAYDGRPQRFRGETGAQSSIIPAFDALLGIDCSSDPLGAHVKGLREYMPAPHRRFLDALAARPSVRQYVHGTPSRELVSAYDRCIGLSVDFRRQHLEYAGLYIHAQQRKTMANPTDVGTGGTPFIRYLQQHVHDIDGYRVGA